MENTCMLTMYYADCTGNAKNNKYPNKIDVVDTAALIECSFGKQIAKQDDYIPPEIYNFKPSLMPNDFSDVGQAEILTREHENNLVFTTATGYLRYNGVLWEASDEKAQAVVQDLTASQLDDAEGYRLKAMELMKQNGALSILASMSKSKALNLLLRGKSIHTICLKRL